MEALLAVVTAVGAGLAYASLRRVPEDTVCTVHRFGRYRRTLTPGLRFTLPFFDQIAHRVRLIGHQVELAPLSLDEALVARGAVYYQILEPERAGDALDDVDALVERAAAERLVAIAPRTGSIELSSLAQQLKFDLNQHLAAIGLRVTRCQLQAA